MGGFDNGIYIDTITLPDDNEWAHYHAADPIRFPEIIDNETTKPNEK